MRFFLENMWTVSFQLLKSAVFQQKLDNFFLDDNKIMQSAEKIKIKPEETTFYFFPILGKLGSGGLVKQIIKKVWP